jgi:hypothetical protein
MLHVPAPVYVRLSISSTKADNFSSLRYESCAVKSVLRILSSRLVSSHFLNFHLIFRSCFPFSHSFPCLSISASERTRAAIAN